MTGEERGRLKIGDKIYFRPCLGKDNNLLIYVVMSRGRSISIMNQVSGWIGWLIAYENYEVLNTHLDAFMDVIDEARK